MFNKELNKLKKEISLNFINSMINKKLNDEFLIGAQKRLKKFTNINYSKQTIAIKLSEMAYKFKYENTSFSENFLISKLLDIKFSQSTPYEKAQIKTIKNAFKNYNLNISQGSKNKDSMFLNKGKIIFENPENKTRSFDLSIFNNDGNYLFNKIFSMYIALKNINSNGSAQKDQLNEIIFLAENSPNKNNKFETLIIAIIDGNYLKIDELNKIQNQFKNKSFEIYNSTDSFINKYKKIF